MRHFGVGILRAVEHILTMLSLLCLPTERRTSVRHPCVEIRSPSRARTKYFFRELYLTLRAYLQYGNQMLVC